MASNLNVSSELFHVVGRVAKNARLAWRRLMPDNHSEVEPPLPIPNRVVKRLSADDSADTCAKVGHCQAPLGASLTSSEVGLLRF